jgi:hypothetical protein
MTSDKELPNGCVQFSLLHSKKIVTKMKNQCHPHYDYDDNEVNVDDLSVLPNVNPASILDATKTRFLNKKIYSSCGSVILSINPFERIHGLYGQQMIKKYSDPTMDGLPSHLYLIPSRAYTSFCNFGKNQAILISGESGAGKTEAAKECLNFLTNISTISATADVRVKKMRHSSTAAVGHSPSDAADGRNIGEGHQISSMILEASTILESFGNASTSRNLNSSRFGKWMEINYDQNNAITKSTIFAYLLEKSRVTKQLTNERNYHIFYQLLSGLSLEELAAWKIFPQTVAYRYLPAECMMHPLINDGDKLHETITAFKACGFPLHDIYAILKIVGAVLLLGNMEFESTESDESCVVSSADQTLEWTASILSIPQDMLRHALVSRTIESGIRRSVISIKLNVAKASNGRDSLARGIYERLFHGIIAMLNERHSSSHTSFFDGSEGLDFVPLTPSGMDFASDIRSDKSLHRIVDTTSNRCIGLLDIFGFEILERNSFEQLCINYCNEILQSHFNYIVFTAETELYKSEGIHCEAIESKDNKLVIGEIEGLFKTLDDEGKLPKGSSRAWYDKSKKNTKASALISYIQKRESFVVSHYAAKVEYHFDGMLEKNLETLTNELIQAMMHSTDPIMNRLFGVVPPVVSSEDMSLPPPPLTTPGSLQRRASKVRYSFSTEDQSADAEGRLIPTQLSFADNESTAIPQPIPSSSPFRSPSFQSEGEGMMRPPVTPISSSRKSIDRFKSNLAAIHVDGLDHADYPTGSFSTASPAAGSMSRSASMRLSVSGSSSLTPSNASSSLPRQQSLNTKTLSWTFKNQLSSLMVMLRQAENHFIRCVKSNGGALPFVYDSKLVNAQLAYSGVYEVVQIQQSGMPCRMPHSDFMQRYKCLAPSRMRHRFSTPTDLVDYLKGYFNKKQAKEIEASVSSGSQSPRQYNNQVLTSIQRGRTYVFMKSHEQNLLEKTRRKLFFTSACTIQKSIRRHLYRNLFKAMIQSVRKFSEAITSFNLDLGESSFVAINTSIDRYCFLQRRMVYQFYTERINIEILRLRQQRTFLDSIESLMSEFSYTSLTTLSTLLHNARVLLLLEHPAVVKATDTCKRFNTANEICQNLYKETSSAENLHRLSLDDMTNGLGLLGDFQDIIPCADQVQQRLSDYLLQVEDEMSSICSPLRASFLRSALHYDDASFSLLPVNADAARQDPVLVDLVSSLEAVAFLCQDTRQLYRDCLTFLTLRDVFVAKDDHQGALDYITQVEDVDVDLPLTAELQQQLVQFKLWADMELTIVCAQQSLQSAVTPKIWLRDVDSLPADYLSVIDTLLQYHQKFSLVAKPTRTIVLLSRVSECMGQLRLGYVKALTDGEWDQLRSVIEMYSSIAKDFEAEGSSYQSSKEELQVFRWHYDVYQHVRLLEEYSSKTYFFSLSLAEKDFSSLMERYELALRDLNKVKLFIQEQVPNKETCRELHEMQPALSAMIELRRIVYQTSLDPTNVERAHESIASIREAYPAEYFMSFGMQDYLEKELEYASYHVLRIECDEMLRSSCRESESELRYFTLGEQAMNVNGYLLEEAIARQRAAIKKLEDLIVNLCPSIQDEIDTFPFHSDLRNLFTFARELLLGRIYLSCDVDTDEQFPPLDDLLTQLDSTKFDPSSIPSAGIMELMHMRRELIQRLTIRDYQRLLQKSLINAALVPGEDDELQEERCSDYYVAEADYADMSNAFAHLDDIVSIHLSMKKPLYLARLQQLASHALSLRAYIMNNQWYEAYDDVTTIKDYLDSFDETSSSTEIFSGLQADADLVRREHEALQAVAMVVLQLATLPCWSLVPALHMAGVRDKTSTATPSDLLILQSMDLSSLDEAINRVRPSSNGHQVRVLALAQDVRNLLRQLKYGQVALIAEEETKRLVTEYESLSIDTKRILLVQQYIRTKQFLKLLLQLMESSPMIAENAVKLSTFIPASPSKRRESIAAPANILSPRQTSYDLLRMVDELKYSLDYSPSDVEWLYETCVAYCDLKREVETASESLTSSPHRSLNPNDHGLSLIWSNLIESAHFLEEVLEEDYESKIRALSDGASDSSAADISRFFKIIQRKIHDAYKLALSLKDREESNPTSSALKLLSLSSTIKSPEVEPVVPEWKMKLRTEDKLNPYGVHHLRRAGYLDEDIVEASVDLKYMCACDIDAALLRKKGKSVKALVRAGYTGAQLFKGGFTVIRLKADGFSAKELFTAGATIRHLKLALFSEWEILTAGYDVRDLRAAGYDVNLLVPYLCSGSCPGAKIKSMRARARYLVGCGFTLAEIRLHGFTATQLLGSKLNISAKAMLDAGYDVRELRAAGVDVSALMDAGLGIDQLLKVGYDDMKLLQHAEFIAAVERDILMDLFRLTCGERWKDSANWSSSHPISKWSGVKVALDRNSNVQRVSELHLWGNNLSGELPARLVGLRMLQELHLQDNMLSGSLPEVYCQLPQLKIMDVTNNRKMIISNKVVKTLGSVLHYSRPSPDAVVPSNQKDFSEEKKDEELVEATAMLKLKGLPPQKHRVQAAPDVDMKFSSSLQQISQAAPTAKKAINGSKSNASAASGKVAIPSALKSLFGDQSTGLPSSLPPSQSSDIALASESSSKASALSVKDDKQASKASSVSSASSKKASSALESLFASRFPPPRPPPSASLSNTKEATDSSEVLGEPTVEAKLVDAAHQTPARATRPLLSPLDTGEYSAFKTPPDTPSVFQTSQPNDQISPSICGENNSQTQSPPAAGQLSQRNSFIERSPIPSLSVTNRRGSAAEKYLSSISAQGAPLDGNPPLPISPLSRRNSTSSIASSQNSISPKLMSNVSSFDSTTSKETAAVPVTTFLSESSLKQIPVAQHSKPSQDTLVHVDIPPSAQPSPEPVVQPSAQPPPQLSVKPIAPESVKSKVPSINSKLTTNSHSLKSTSVSKEKGASSPKQSASAALITSTDTAPAPRFDLVEDLEFDALMVFFHYTNGKKWKKSTNWSSSLPLSSWYGVTTNNRGHVVKIELPHNCLEGVIPAESFEFLLDLEVLDLRYNALFSSLPSTISKLKRLSHLHLHCNAFSGPLPNKIGSMNSLVVLDIRSNQFSGILPESIRKLKCLSVFAFTSNLFLLDYKVEDIRKLLPGCRLIKV